jgi:signal transduction histidine kinase
VTDPHQHLDVGAILERLRDTPLFGGLDEDSLRALAASGEIHDLAPGDLLIREGEEADALFVVLDGELDVTKRSGTSEIPLARVGPGALQGEIAALEGGRRLASVRAATSAEVLQIPTASLRQLLASGPDAALAIIQTVVRRLRVIEAMLREREKLAGLGTLAAGLAHELNNPAAALRRSASGLEQAIARRDALERPAELPPRREARRLGALERSDAVDALAGLLGPDEASVLVDGGWTADELRALPHETLSWLAADASVHELLGEVRMAGERISEIVGAVKGYAYLDQAPVQRVDVRTGLDQTLVILRHRLRDGIEVVREYADELPEIEVYGSELNQVWTNLVDNAVDAMDGKGRITLRAHPAPDEDGVRVEICDSGAGIPPDVRARLFEPFYTTKAPGKGTGLGLHISHTVVAQHGGRIEVDSEPGRTCFEIILPATLPRSEAPSG